MQNMICFIRLDQGFPTFVVRGRGPHKLLHNSPRAGHLTCCDCFGICCNPPNQEVFRKYSIFSILTKRLRGPKNGFAGWFCPRAVVWRPWITSWTILFRWTVSLF